MKSAIKLRRDSGLADTSDAEADCKNESRDHETTHDISKMSHGFDEQSNENLIRSVLNIVANTDDDEVAKEYGIESEMVSDNTKAKANQNPTEDKSNDGARETIKSVLNVIDNKSPANEKAEPAIWKSEAYIPPDPDTKEETLCESINCDNIKHKTNLYDPSTLNKGHYLEVKFKNDLIFDLDM